MLLLLLFVLQKLFFLLKLSFNLRLLVFHLLDVALRRFTLTFLFARRFLTATILRFIFVSIRKDLDLLALAFEFSDELVDTLFDFVAALGLLLLLMVCDSFGSHLLIEVAALLHVGQHLSELVDLLFVLSEQGVLGVFIYLGLVLNALGSGSVPEGGEGFIEVVVGWGESSDHHCFGVAS